MKKRVIVLIVLIVFALVGCGSGHESTNIVEVIETGSSHTVYVDTKTKVMYLKTYHSGVCVMVNQDGTPKLWEGK